MTADFKASGVSPLSQAKTHVQFQVVSGAGDDLVNKVVEEVSKTSTEEKQNLSAKVLQAIVEQEPDKINIINDDVKDTMIEQTIEAAKNHRCYKWKAGG